jgi:hypothetical protein
MKTIEEILGPKEFIFDDTRRRTKPLTDRPGDEVFLVPHHSVSTTLGSIMNEFRKTARILSATAAVGPLVSGQDAYESRHVVPWNTHRPATTASWIDDQAITFEMANLRLAHPWPVGQTGKQWAAELAAAMHVELGMPLNAWHIVDHQTVNKRGWGSYPTECCGTDMREDIPWIINEAQRIVLLHRNPGIDKEIIMALEARYVARNEPGQPVEYMLLDEDLPPLATNRAQDGYRVSLDRADGEAYGVLAGTANGAPLMMLPRSKYVKTQELARAFAQQKRAARQAELVAAFKAAQA